MSCLSRLHVTAMQCALMVARDSLIESATAVGRAASAIPGGSRARHVERKEAIDQALKDLLEGPVHTLRELAEMYKRAGY